MLAAPESNNRRFAGELKTNVLGKGYELTVSTVPPMGMASSRARGLVWAKALAVARSRQRTDRIVRPRRECSPARPPESRACHAALCRAELLQRAERRMPCILHLRRLGIHPGVCMRRRLLSPPLLAVLLSAGCSKVGIDTSAIAAVSNDDTYAMLAYVWDGVQAAINSKKEPLTSPFTLALDYTAACPNGGQRSYQGTLAGTDSIGTGSATVSMTGTLTECVVDDGTTIRTFAATGIAATGTIAITADTYAATSLHLTASSVTVNGTTCTGGIDVVVTAASPSSQPTATGVACGRSGSVTLP
jgi:hypothetical protein